MFLSASLTFINPRDHILISKIKWCMA